VESILNYVVA